MGDPPLTGLFLLLSVLLLLLFLKWIFPFFLFKRFCSCWRQWKRTNPNFPAERQLCEIPGLQRNGPWSVQLDFGIDRHTGHGDHRQWFQGSRRPSLLMRFNRLGFFFFFQQLSHVIGSAPILPRILHKTKPFPKKTCFYYYYFTRFYITYCWFLSSFTKGPF